MDEERLAVGEAMGLSLKTELQAMNELYKMDAASVYQLNKTSETHGNVNSAPSSSYSRYITEDAPYLLIPCLEFARLMDVKTPIVTSIIHITNAFNEVDYFTSGRTLIEMGLNDMSMSEILIAVS